MKYLRRRAVYSGLFGGSRKWLVVGGTTWALNYIGRVFGLGKLAWTNVSPEYDPFKYCSFPVNGGILTHDFTRQADKSQIASKLPDRHRVIECCRQRRVLRQSAFHRVCHHPKFPLCLGMPHRRQPRQRPSTG